MMDSDREIFLTQDKLVAFSKFEIDWSDICGDSFYIDSEGLEVENPYVFTLRDLTEALENIYDADLTVGEFYVLWYFPIMHYCFRDLYLDEILGQNVEDFKNTNPPGLIESEEDMMFYIFKGLSECEERLMNEKEHINELLGIKEMLEAVEFYEEDSDKPVTERRFTDLQKYNFLSQWDNNMMLQDAPRDILILFRRFTDELSGKDDFFALRIKAYALYEGNAVYMCDRKAAVPLLEKLWKRFNFAYAATTLGYIYLNGYSDDDSRPDYEKAFFYFSVASTFGIVEAKYKLADMFLGGLYVARNPDIARDIVMDLYSTVRYEFERGKTDNDFADVAYRLGHIYICMPPDIPDDMELASKHMAFMFLLQAKFAVRLKLENSHRSRDIDLLARIEKDLDDIRPAIVLSNKKTFESYSPSLPKEFAGTFPNVYFHINVRELKGKRIKVKIQRLSLNGEPMSSLVCMPWFEYTGMSDSLSFTVTGDTAYIFGEERNFNCSHITVGDFGAAGFEIRFSDGPHLIASVNGSSVVYSKP